MKIVNKTNYDTKYLRKLFLECEKHIFRTYLVHGENKNRHVEVRTHYANWIGGCAWINSCSLIMKIPLPKHGRLFARQVAQVYLHEVGHNIGLRHKKMVLSSKIDVSWWPDQRVPIKQLVEKPKKNLIELRAINAQKKLDEWEKKFNRAKLFMKKYQRKVKYYETKTAALGKEI